MGAEDRKEAGERLQEITPQEESRTAGQEEKKRKRAAWKKLGLAAAGILLVGSLLVTVTQVLAIRFADTVIRYSFTGLENMFHRSYEYYAIVRGIPVKVPVKLVERRYLKPKSSKEVSRYDDDGVDWYFVQLQYNEQGTPRSEKDPKIELSHGKERFLTYREWTSQSGTVTERERRLFAEIVEELYDFERGDIGIENCAWYTGDGAHRGLISFMVVTDGTRVLVFQDSAKNKVVYEYKDGKISRLMAFPKGGGFDYCIFRSRPNRKAAG